MRNAKAVLLAGVVTLGLFRAAPLHGAENEYLNASSKPKGLLITSKATGVSAELTLIAKDGKPAGEPSIKLPQGKSFVEVSPTGEALEVRMKMRLATVPGFHLDDVLLDPTACKPGTVYVPGENFVMLVPEGGKSAFVLVWPHGAKQVPSLVKEGEGKEARFSAARVTFDQKPLYLGLLDQVVYVDNLDQGLNFTGAKEPDIAAEVKTGFKFPFAASWWTTLLAEATSQTVKTSKGEQKLREFPPLVPGPTWLVTTKLEPAWDDACSYHRLASTAINGEWVLRLEKRWSPYRVAVTYPKTRARKSGYWKRWNVMGPEQATPPNSITFTDILCEALGKEELFAIADYEGLAGRGNAPKDEPVVESTCGAWGTLPRALSTKNKDEFLKCSEGCYNFCRYKKVRVDEFRETGKKLVELCAPRHGDQKVQELAERVGHWGQELGKYWEERNEGFRKGLKELAQKYPELLTEAEAANENLDEAHFKRLRAYYFKVYNEWAEKDNAKANKMIARFHWTTPGQILDTSVVSLRRIAQRAGQEAALKGVESPETREFALNVRKVIQQGLRQGHGPEHVPNPMHVITLEGR